MNQPSSRYLTPENVLRLANYELSVKTFVEGYLAGRHRSRQRGSSIEFHEYRQYTPGDDPSMVDWRVFARTDRHYLKTFEQETNLECHLFVDSSASMGYPDGGMIDGGKLSKLDYASFVAACLAWIVTVRNDRVSLHLFDDQVRKSFPPGTTRRHLHAMLDALETNQPGRPTSLPEALKKAQPLLKRRGTLVLLSDFYDDPEELFRALNPYLHRGFKIHLFHVLAPGEAELEDRGLTRFVDMETDDQLIVHTGTLREAYRQQLQDHTRALRRLSNSRGVDYAMTTTAEPFFHLLDRMVKN